MSMIKPLTLDADGDVTEAALTDYLKAIGLAFGGLSTFTIEKIGRLITTNEPNLTQKPSYLGNGEIDYIETFNSATQINANRILRADMTYNADINPLTEVWKIYDTDGVTVLRTITFTYAYTGNDITNISMVTT